MGYGAVSKAVRDLAAGGQVEVGLVHQTGRNNNKGTAFSRLDRPQQKHCRPHPVSEDGVVRLGQRRRDDGGLARGGLLAFEHNPR